MLGTIGFLWLTLFWLMLYNLIKSDFSQSFDSSRLGWIAAMLLLVMPWFCVRSERTSCGICFGFLVVIICVPGLAFLIMYGMAEQEAFLYSNVNVSTHILCGVLFGPCLRFDRFFTMQH